MITFVSRRRCLSSRQLQRRAARTDHGPDCTQPCNDCPQECVRDHQHSTHQCGGHWGYYLNALKKEVP